MSDANLNINLGISDTIKELKDTSTVKETDKTTALLVRTIHAALSPLEKWVLQKEYNLSATKKLLEEKLVNVPIKNIITPPPYIAVPALQSISYCMDDPQLRNMYADLLAKSMNSETVGNVHPTFVEIIKQMSPYDAKIFKTLVEKIVQPCIGIAYINKKTKEAYPIQDIVAFKNIGEFPVIQTQIALENLERLKLIEINKNSKYANNNEYNDLINNTLDIVNEFIVENQENLNINDFKVVYNHFVILIRGFGQYFARICLGQNFENLE